MYIQQRSKSFEIARIRHIFLRAPLRTNTFRGPTISQLSALRRRYRKLSITVELVDHNSAPRGNGTVIFWLQYLPTASPGPAISCDPHDRTLTASPYVMLRAQYYHSSRPYRSTLHAAFRSCASASLNSLRFQRPSSPTNNKKTQVVPTISLYQLYCYCTIYANHRLTALDRDHGLSSSRCTIVSWYHLYSPLKMYPGCPAIPYGRTFELLRNHRSCDPRYCLILTLGLITLVGLCARFLFYYYCYYYHFDGPISTNFRRRDRHYQTRAFYPSFGPRWLSRVSCASASKSSVRSAQVPILTG